MHKCEQRNWISYKIRNSELIHYIVAMTEYRARLLLRKYASEARMKCKI